MITIKKDSLLSLPTIKDVHFISIDKVSESLMVLENAHYSLKVITDRMQQLTIQEIQPFMKMIQTELSFIEEEIKLLSISSQK